MARPMILTALFSTALAFCACAPEEDLACLQVDTAVVCLPSEFAAPHPEADRMLFFDEGGWIEIYSVVGHPFAALGDLAESCPSYDARTIAYEFVDDYAVYYYHLLLQDDGLRRFYEFGGILSIALRDDSGKLTGVANVVFRGYWPEESADTMRARIDAFMSAVEIDD